MFKNARSLALMLCPLLFSWSGNTPAAAAPTTLTVKWTATGDDGRIGTATRYELRYTTKLLNALTFYASRPASGLPTPHPPGSLETYTLTGLATDSTYFIAIRAVDDAGNKSLMSNVLIRPSGLLAVDADSSRIAFTEPWPNPATRALQLAITLARAGEATTHVYDVAGRHVRSLAQGRHAAGRLPVAWDLTDEQGRRVAPGAYTIRASALGQQWMRRVVVVN